MAKIDPPKKDKPVTEKVAVTKIVPPLEEKVAPLQLDIGKTVKTEYKAYAAGRGQSMKEFFTDMFEFYKDNHQ